MENILKEENYKENLSKIIEIDEFFRLQDKLSHNLQNLLQELIDLEDNTKYDQKYVLDKALINTLHTLRGYEDPE